MAKTRQDKYPSIGFLHKFNSLALNLWPQPLQNGSFIQKPKKFEIYPLCLKHQAHKVHISSCVCFCIKFCFYLCKFAKATSMINALITFSSLLQIFYRIFAKKILNFICRVERGRDCFFKTLYRFCLTQKSPTSRNLTQKNPVNFKLTSATFITSLFRTKKCKIYRSF